MHGAKLGNRSDNGEAGSDMRAQVEAESGVASGSKNVFTNTYMKHTGGHKRNNSISKNCTSTIREKNIYGDNDLKYHSRSTAE